MGVFTGSRSLGRSPPSAILLERALPSGTLGNTNPREVEIIMRWWPRTIRWQMLFGLVLLEALSIALFALVLVRLQQHDVYDRAVHRLAHQASSVALQAKEAYEQQRSEEHTSELQSLRHLV